MFLPNQTIFCSLLTGDPEAGNALNHSRLAVLGMGDIEGLGWIQMRRKERNSVGIYLPLSILNSCFLCEMLFVFFFQNKNLFSANDPEDMKQNTKTGKNLKHLGTLNSPSLSLDWEQGTVSPLVQNHPRRCSVAVPNFKKAQRKDKC